MEPKVLKWLRESSGWKIEEVSKRLNTTLQIIQDLEAGAKSPTLRQLKNMASLYKYPLASFLLSEPRKQMPLPRDYRFLPGRKDVFDKKTILAIRKSRNLQDLGMELSLNIKSDTKPKIKKASLTDDPNATAVKYRRMFDLTLKRQIQFRDAYRLFNYLRDVLEDVNILVFQFSMQIEDARGFALVDELPAVIVVNSKDSIEARLFTLMHEFGHVLLGDTVIDIPKESSVERNNTEKWCNAFSSSFLLPEQTDEDLFQEDTQFTDTETLNKLSKKYKVSKAVLLHKMLNLNHISKAEFESVLGRPVSKNKKKTESGQKGIVVSPDKRCLSEVGNRFVSLVANNFDKDIITYTDALSYLSIKSRNFEKVLAKAKR